MRIILFLSIWFFISQTVLLGDSESKEEIERSGSAVVFMYHRFGNDRYSSTNIRLKQFERHLEYIQKNNFNVWPLSKIIRYIQNEKKLPKNTVALSIDDAYISTYKEAYPRLKTKKFPFTIFVSTAAVDTGSKNYMSWEQMREMSMNGAEFANHSLTHAFLLPNSSETKEQWKSRLKIEIEVAQKRLQEELGAETNSSPKLFSYPFGEYNSDIIEFLKELNYIGITQTSGVFSSDSSLREVPRYAMAEAYGEIEDFILKINTLPLPVESVSPNEPLIDLNNPPLLRLRLKKHIDNIGCYIASGERIDVKWVSDTELEIQSRNPLNPPRDRYTCTAPSKEGRWYWYSNLWIIR